MSVIQDLPDIVVIIILAIVQGVAEFLPISSSGHLVVLSELLGKQPSVQLNVMLHAGTLLSILVFYRARIISLFSTDRRVVVLLIVGSLPVGVIGVWIKLAFPEVAENTLLAGFMLIVTGFILMATQWLNGGKRKPSADERSYVGMSTWQALWVGTFQAFALLPGISRSGATIFAGQQSGLSGESAATFSFLLAIPAILGATAFEFKSMLDDPQAGDPIGELLVGAVIAFAVGLLALRWLVRILHRQRLHLFAYWVIPLGFLVVVWQLYQSLMAV